MYFVQVYSLYQKKPLAYAQESTFEVLYFKYFYSK